MNAALLFHVYMCEIKYTWADRNPRTCAVGTLAMSTKREKASLMVSGDGSRSKVFHVFIFPRIPVNKEIISCRHNLWNQQRETTNRHQQYHHDFFIFIIIITIVVDTISILILTTITM